MSAAPVLLVFAKAPIAGHVKTRLAASLGNARATAVYRELLATTIDCAITARDAGVVGGIELWCTPELASGELAAIASRCGATLQRQTGDDLGQRMAAALASAMTRAATALLVGTDCPVLRPAHLAQAAALLATHDAVLGPAEDGGFVLVGARRHLPLADVRWSTRHARADTLAGFARAGIACAQLPMLWDVDDAAGLARWRRLHDTAKAADA